MSKFLTGPDLEEAITSIIWDAKDILLIMSPFIKLDDYFIKLFNNHENNEKLRIVIVFGKNQQDISKSLSLIDYNFFKKFKNITIVYVPNLHAKYYGNEKKGMITSINLYDHSFKNNIEFGVYSEIPFLNLGISKSADMDAWETCWDIIENNEVIFAKRPVYEKGFLSSLTGKKYIESRILYDVTDNIYLSRREIKKYDDFPLEIDASSKNSKKPSRLEVEKESLKISDKSDAFCIRCSTSILRNPYYPYCLNCYKAWNRFSQDEYQPEHYCHLCGNQHNSKKAQPACYSCYTKNKNLFVDYN